MSTRLLLALLACLTLPCPFAPAAAPPRSGPLVRMVNTKRITLNFEVKDVELSRLSGVELWYTYDAKLWKKYDAPSQAQPISLARPSDGCARHRPPRL